MFYHTPFKMAAQDTQPPDAPVRSSILSGPSCKLGAISAVDNVWLTVETTLCSETSQPCGRLLPLKLVRGFTQPRWFPWRFHASWIFWVIRPK